MARFFARLLVGKPWILICGWFSLLIAAVLLIVKGPGFDTDVLNVLPANVTAVSGLRTYQEDFMQKNEMAFVLEWTAAPADIEEEAGRFADLMALEPWCSTIFRDPPLDDQSVINPLFLNLQGEKFNEAIKALEPGTLTARLHKLVDGVVAGSPRAQVELQSDPLGFAVAALAPVKTGVSVERAFARFSEDKCLALVPFTTPEGLTPAEVMRSVRDFVVRASAAMGENAPQILVTGHGAYVEEIASSMRRDVNLTGIISLFAVMLIFWLGYRRVLPLAGIALALGVAAVLSMACGVIIFGKLNVIAIGFCSILFGIGNDFSLLVCQRYATSRAAGMSREDSIAEALARTAPSIGWVALTTALGFLALLFAGSSGFQQLGVLVAFGIGFAALTTLTTLPLFLHGGATLSTEPPAPARDRHPSGALLLGSILALAAACFALSPWQPLIFDLAPTSLEPKHIPAAQAVQKLMHRLPGAYEPTLVVVKSPTAETLAKLDETMQALHTEGLITAISSPSPLFLDTRRFEQNKKTLSALDTAPIVASFAELGIEYPVQEKIQKLLDTPSTGVWRDCLPAHSPWWFLLQRTISREGNCVVATLRTPDDVTAEQRQEIAAHIQTVPGAAATGWSQMIAELIPWAQGELFFFAGVVLGAIVLVLALVYRNMKLWLLHIAGLAVAAAFTIALLKIFAVKINILNVLALPLILGVGVDYGTHIVLAVEERCLTALHNVLKPVFLSGLTTIAGFGALCIAQNSALAGLGYTCAIGVLSCLAATFLIIAPIATLIVKKN